MKTLKKFTALSVLALTLSACGTLSDVKSDGTTDNPVFPKLEDSTFNPDTKQIGSWADEHNLQKIERGMTKPQLYNLIGRPHFSEGFRVREWDYVFNFRQNGEHKQCQFKVLFDKDMHAQQFLWLPAECANYVARK